MQLKKIHQTEPTGARQWGMLSKVLKARDPRLKRIIEKVGPPRLKLERNPYRALVEAILSQQLAPAAAQSIIRKFSALSNPFPTAREVLGFPIDQIRKAGVSPQKASYIRDLSISWGRPKWRRGLPNLSDERIIERLTEVRGIGVWTAQMFLIFSLGRPNVLPSGDYGVRRGLELLFGMKHLPDPKEVSIIVPHWEGAFSVGCWYLWAALDQGLFDETRSFG